MRIRMYRLVRRRALPRPDGTADVTVYQWLVLLLASAGWVFDAFEGQLFNLTRVDMLHELLGPTATDAAVKAMGERLLAVFLLGGTLGGSAFGSLADRFGRKPILSATILCYSVFAGLTYFATSVWQIAALRFLVALGVGGEWAVAASLVAEVFPPRRGLVPQASFTPRAFSAPGGRDCGAAGRRALALGVCHRAGAGNPGVWVRRQVHEPKRWQEAEHSVVHRGRFRDLLGDRQWARRALLGLALAAVGLGTFWGVTVAGQDLTRELLVRHGVAKTEAARQSQFAYGIVETAGGGLGLLCFGPLAEWLGRRGRLR